MSRGVVLTPDTLEGMTHTREVNAMSPGTLVERMEMVFLQADDGRVVARMPVAHNTQPMGLLHGGASAALAETVGSMAANFHAAPAQAVGIELNITHHRSVSEGFVTATATPLTEGRSVACYAIEVRDDQDRLVATSRLTCAIRQPR